MDLTWSTEEEAFRAEARSWLEAHVPTGLASGDTREGFAAHLEWERLLYRHRWAVVSWPAALAGAKTWTTRGAFCAHLSGLFHSDLETERHPPLEVVVVCRS